MNLLKYIHISSSMVYGDCRSPNPENAIREPKKSMVL